MNKPKERKVYIEFLRIVAIYMVLFTHTETRGFYLFKLAQGSVLYPFYLFNSIFIMIAVPLFLMASGVVLLGKEESLKHIVTVRFLRFGIVLLVASAIDYCYMCLLHTPQEMSLSRFLRQLYCSEHSTLWYLYMYLAYILMLPFLRCLAKAMTEREYVWMFLMYGAMQFLFIFDYLISQGSWSHNGNFSFFITADYVFYPLMGYFIDQKLEEKHFSKRNLLILTLASFAAVGICCIMTHYKYTLVGGWDYCETFFKTLCFLPTVTVFYGTKYWFQQHSLPNRISSLIVTLGSTTFGLYLIERICRDETAKLYDYLAPYICTLPACWVWTAVACCVGMTVIYFIKKIPGVRKFI